MYQKVDTNLNFVDREKQVEKFWKENHIFEKSMEDRKDDPTYMFYDGPPTANGKPHIGHVLTRVIKDMIPRYRTMKGYMVPRKAGWDTHGLPVELEVEKKLGLDGKEQIEEYGMEPFIKQCKESVWKYKGMWEDFSSTVGFWADMEHPYVTYYDDYIESEWWALKEIWNKKLLYKGFKIVPYCPRCGTPLSAQEVSQGYKTVKERSAIVRFKVVGEDEAGSLSRPSDEPFKHKCPVKTIGSPAPFRDSFSEYSADIGKEDAQRESSSAASFPAHPGTRPRVIAETWLQHHAERWQKHPFCLATEVWRHH